MTTTAHCHSAVDGELGSLRVPRTYDEGVTLGERARQCNTKLRQLPTNEALPFSHHRLETHGIRTLGPRTKPRDDGVNAE